MTAKKYTLADDRQEAGLSLGQVLHLLGSVEGAPQGVTRQQLAELEASNGASDHELALWLQVNLYMPLPDDFRRALGAWDVPALQAMGAVICHRTDP